MKPASRAIRSGRGAPSPSGQLVQDGAEDQPRGKRHGEEADPQGERDAPRERVGLQDAPGEPGAAHGLWAAHEGIASVTRPRGEQLVETGGGIGGERGPRAVLEQPTVVHHHDLIDSVERGEAVGDDDGRPPGKQPIGGRDQA